MVSHVMDVGSLIIGPGDGELLCSDTWSGDQERGTLVTRRGGLS